MERRRGFTLFELLVVIVVLLILSSLSVALLGVFLRGQGVRQGALVLTQAVAQCRGEAARNHRTQVLVFVRAADGGSLEIHEDRGDARKVIERMDLPKGVGFDHAPEWVAVSPSGTMAFSPGFPPVPASLFDSVLSGPHPAPIGDVILGIRGQPYKMCVSLERSSGKVRRTFFLNRD